MAEIDRIKALAGLLNDDDDDLFPSSSGEDDPTISVDSASSQAENQAQVKQSNATASASKARHGVVKTQQQDAILHEMQAKKLNAENIKTCTPQQAKPSPMTNIKNRLGQPRLTVQTDDQPNPESNEENDQLIFGRPQTFGAAGGYTTDYMPNVKERAVAISAWKILEMKKERKNGHARAKEWAVRDEKEERDQDSDGSYSVEGEEENGNGQKDESKPKKGKIPSFLAQFDHRDEENTENSVNGVVLSPTTPRGGVRVPLSPRHPNVSSPGPRSVLSPRGVGISASPRNQLSPRNDPSPSKTSGLKVNVAVSPRNKVMSPRHQVLSPRTNALLSPSMAAGQSLKAANNVYHGKTFENKPPMSPRVHLSAFKSKSIKHEEVAAPSDSTPKPFRSAANEKVQSLAKPQAVKFNGVEVMGELASALERRYAKCGAPESPIAKKDSDSIGSSGEVDESNNNDQIEGLDVLDDSSASPVIEKGIGGEKVAVQRNNTTGSFQRTKVQPTLEERSVLVKSERIGHKSTSTAAESKTITETLEEASRFLQTSDSGEDSIKEGGSSDSIDSKIDDELSAAAELARALDKLLVGSDLSSEEEYGEMHSDSDIKANNGGDAMTDLSDTVHETKPKKKLPIKEQITRRVYFEDEQVKGWDQWNLSGNNDANSMFAFPTEFKGMSSSQFDSEFTSSSGDDSFFGASYSGEESSQPPERQVNASTDQMKAKTSEQNKSPKVKVNLKINGAAILKIDKESDESMFFVSQPSPSCGDNAGLLQHSFGSSKDPAAPCLPERVMTDTPKKRGVALNSPTKKRLNNLGLKLGLIHNAVPSKSERGKGGGDSPSMAGLLNSDETTAGEDENVGMVSVAELGQLTPSNQQSRRFFEGPSSPLMYSSSAALGSQRSMNAQANQVDSSGGKMKKASKILQRIKTPLLSRKTVRGAELNDDASI